MSRKINIEDLSDEDIIYLAQRDRLPDDSDIQERAEELELAAPSRELEDRGNTGTVRNISTEELEAELERRRSEQAENPNSETKGNPAIDEDDDEDEPEEEEAEDYEEGWNNEQRRAELASRSLSLDGNKDELIARLLESDQDAAEDEE